MSSRRMFRVNELVKREVGEIVRAEFSTEISGLISVTDAEVTNDLRSAYIYYSIIGTNSQQQNVGTLLNRYRHLIQRHLARRIRMKRTPVLTFFPDASIERGNRILQILDQLNIQSPEQESENNENIVESIQPAPIEPPTPSAIPEENATPVQPRRARKIASTKPKKPAKRKTKSAKETKS